MIEYWCIEVLGLGPVWSEMLLPTYFLIESKTLLNSVSVSKVLMSIKKGSPYASVGTGRSGCIKVLPELLTTNAYVLWPWLKNVMSDNRSSTWISVPTTPIKFPLWKQGKVIVIIRPENRARYVYLKLVVNWGTNTVIAVQKSLKREKEIQPSYTRMVTLLCSCSFLNAENFILECLNVH